MSGRKQRWPAGSPAATVQKITWLPCRGWPHMVQPAVLTGGHPPPPPPPGRGVAPTRRGLLISPGCPAQLHGDFFRCLTTSGTHQRCENLNHIHRMLACRASCAAYYTSQDGILPALQGSRIQFVESLNDSVELIFVRRLAGLCSGDCDRLRYRRSSGGLRMGQEFTSRTVLGLPD